MRLKFILLSIAVLSLFSCKKDENNNVQHIPVSDTLIHDISYGSDAAQKLDLSLAANRTGDTKLIILIHGGGWNSGDKKDLAFLASGFQKRGFAVANINYRLSPQSDDNYKMQLDDISAAVKYLQSEAAYYVFSSKNFYITGHSAGAHLSLSYAYTRNGNGLIKAAGGMASPTDLVAGATANLGIVGFTTIKPYLGIPLNDSTRPIYENASPVYHVSASSPPTILFQGDADLIVPKAQSIELKDKLNDKGVPVKLVLYPGAGHDWWGDSYKVKNTLDETAAWFNSH